MGHISDAVLRRLDDEPLAVPDRAAEHAATCGRCRARRARIAQDTEFAARLLAAPHPAPDADMAWARLQRELNRGSGAGADRPRPPALVGLRPARVPRVSLRAGLVIGSVGIVVAGTAAAATLTTIFAPTHVAPVSVSQSDVRAISAFMGLGDGHLLGGFATRNGSSTTRFGTIRWSSSGPPHPVSTIAAAAGEAGYSVSLPSRPPAGVGSVGQVFVQPRVNATVTFGSAATGLAGSSVTLGAGPAVVVEYNAASEPGVPTLVVAAMPRPTARSAGASLSQIEGFLLSQPGIPVQLAEEVRLLGDLRTILPVPVPQGASEHSVQVAGSPGVLLTDSSGAVGGVVWEDGRGMLHVVAGLLDSQDLLHVADQLG